MKQRFTFLAPEGTFIDVKNIQVADGIFNLTVPSASAGVERRTTLSLDELPETLTSILQDVHELHIRWIGWSGYKHLSPLVSRQSPGLHVFFTPRDGKKGDQLCSSLQWLFKQNMKCNTVLDSFSRPVVLSERFATSATYQFYHQQRSLDDLVVHLTEFCTTLPRHRRKTCQEQVWTIKSAAEVSLDFDIISHALVITATWSGETTALGSDAHVYNNLNAADHDGPIEIGVMAAEKADEHEELKLGGYLAVLGESEKPAATLFSFPSRHHPLPAHDKTVYNTTFLQPTGLHPKLSVSLPGRALRPPQDTCALHVYLTLPSALFLDRYQLSDPDLLASNGLRALRALSGAEDLEAPDWVVRQWGSASLFQLMHPETLSNDAWEVHIPLHLRYLQSENVTAEGHLRQVTAPWPIVFWACEAEDGLKMSTNPFDRVNVGYDGLFGPKTMFYHIPPGQDNLTLSLHVPTLDPATGAWLSPATLAIVLAGLAWVLWSLVGPVPSKKTDNKNE